MKLAGSASVITHSYITPKTSQITSLYWDGGKINEFPEYLRDVDNNQIYRLELAVDEDKPQIEIKDINDKLVNKVFLGGFRDLTPASEQDFLNFKAKYIEEQDRNADGFINQFGTQ